MTVGLGVEVDWMAMLGVPEADIAGVGFDCMVVHPNKNNERVKMRNIANMRITEFT
jgi:hypothetical protein